MAAAVLSVGGEFVCTPMKIGLIRCVGCCGVFLYSDFGPTVI